MERFVTAVWFRFRAELRTRWRAWLGLALLAGIGGGVTIALAAGARRTDSAYPRLVDEQRPYDVTVFEGGFAGEVEVPPDFLEQVAQLPQVAEAGRFNSLFDNGGRTDEGIRIGEPDYLQTIVATDDESAAILARQKLLDGRHPDPREVDEVAVNFTVADRYELDVGDTFELELFTEAQALAFDEQGRLTSGVLKRVRVVGVFGGAGDFPPRSLGDGAGGVNFTPAFGAANREFAPMKALAVRLKGGSDEVRAFQDGVEGIVGENFTAFDAFGNFSIALQHEATDRAIHLLAVALWVLAGLAGVAVVLIIGQSLFRTAAMESSEHPWLRALGVTEGQLVGLGIIRAAVVATWGALVAIVVAIGLSPLFPLGLARTAEPDPGFAFDGLAVVGGAAALVVVVSLLGALAAWRAARTAAVAGRGTAEGQSVSPVAAALARGGFPAPAVAGVRMALESGRGPTAVPARATLVCAAIGVAALAGALTFGAGLRHLLDTPRLYGWNWDVTVGDGFGADFHDDVVDALSREPSVEAIASGTFAAVEVKGREVFVLATDAVKGSVGPTVIEGRAPSAPDEILLGTETLDGVEADVGDTVPVRFVGTFNGEAADEAPERQLRIVGRGVLPEQSDVGLDDAGAVTYQGLRHLAPGEALARNFFPVEFADGVDPEAGLAAVTDAVELYTVPLQRPTDLVNFGRVESLPVLGGGFLALIALAMLTHLLLSSVRRRRRDLALLKTLGFVRRQVSSTVAWQVTTLAVVALVVGLPIGTAAGRWAWTVAAERLGVVAEPAVPVLVLVLVVPLTFAIANLTAAVPAWFAARTRPAAVLRAE